MKISDIKSNMPLVDVEGKIASKSEIRSVNLRGGGQSLLADAILEDDTGSVNLALWGAQIDSVQVGDMVKIINGYTSVRKGKTLLNVGRYGNLFMLERVQVTEPVLPKMVTLEEERIDLLNLIARRFRNDWSDFDGRWLRDLIDIVLHGDMEEVGQASEEMKQDLREQGATV